MAGDEPLEEQDFKLALANDCFTYKSAHLSAKEKGKLQQSILDTLFKNDATPLYVKVSKELGWATDEGQLSSMGAANEKELAKMEEKIKDAEENLGDIEVRDALRAKADYLAKIGDKGAAVKAYAATESKSAGSGPKLDLVFSLLRLDIASGDWREVREGVKKAKEVMASGGDWERRNRLKLYEAIFLLATRDIKKAAQLFLDSIATFTSSELFSYERCIFYTVVTALVTLDRVSLKEKVVDAPEILTVIDNVPHLKNFLTALYECDYKTFFKAFTDISDSLREDRFIQPHFLYYIREVRVVAYSQFLESYKSVTLQSMADAFGISVGFLDEEIANFIVDGRLPAKIDRVAGVIETKRPDLKNARYQQTLKQGDLLLGRLQKLSKVVDIE